MARTRVGCYLVSIRNGHILLAHVAPGYGPANKWTLPGGGVEWGEDPSEALHREVFEETGFELNAFRYIGVDSRILVKQGDDDGLHWIRLFFTAALDGEPRVTEIDGSVDDARWIPMADLGQLDTVDIINVGLDMMGSDH